MSIRERRLYREGGFTTFEDYCRERWGMSKTHANRMVDAAEVVGILTPIGVTPENEAQARALAPLKDDPAVLQAAWQEVQERAPGQLHNQKRHPDDERRFFVCAGQL